MKEILYRHEYTALRRKLRNNPTRAEQVLWARLQNRKLDGWKFRRQAGIGRYIADFYCPARKLVIEIDGDIHDQKGVKEYDELRSSYIEAVGMRMLRFSNDEVLMNIDSVLKTIAAYQNPSSS
jgi:very-short-patch-repair endonuclease